VAPEQDPHRPAICTLVRIADGAVEASADWGEVASLLGVTEGLRLQVGRARMEVEPAAGTPVRASAAAVEGLRALGPWITVTPGSALAAWDDSLPTQVASPARGALLDAALDVWSRPGFETFMSLPRLRFAPFAHQLAAAGAVLRRMRGRALLADEVGLGKTIEAGLVATELYLRRLARRILILVPAGLVGQWAEELDRKFALPCLVQGSAAWQREQEPWEAPIVLASLAAARRSPHREAATASPWDLVIADEAHRLKNPRSASSLLVNGLQTRYLLLLTATPVENRLDDLFHLVNLVRPGHLGTPAEFRRTYGPGGAAEAVRNLPTLQQRMRGVMVRHRRSEVAVMLPRRLAETLRVTPTPEEARLYARISEHVRQAATGASPAQTLALRSLQRLAGSSPRALAAGLAHAGLGHLLPPSGTAPRTAKTDALLQLLRRHLAQGERVVVFTGFRETLAMLEAALREAGIDAASYHGGLGRREKDAVIAAFSGDLPVLLTTEAAGEGRNLQFCHVMINFDLPWNPMQIEQRLGRIHRIGQEHDVLLHNLVARGTVEDRILAVLEAKINLFELVVGELDMILGRIEDDFDFEAAVFAHYVQSSDEADFTARLETLGQQLTGARTEYLAARGRGDALVPQGEAAE